MNNICIQISWKYIDIQADDLHQHALHGMKVILKGVFLPVPDRMINLDMSDTRACVLYTISAETGFCCFFITVCTAFRKVQAVNK
jgi:hypothetical protein